MHRLRCDSSAAHAASPDGASRSPHICINDRRVCIVAQPVSIRHDYPSTRKPGTRNGAQSAVMGVGYNCRYTHSVSWTSQPTQQWQKGRLLRTQPPKAKRHAANHTLGHIDPRRLARRLVIFTPTGAEIDMLMDRARQDLPGLGANEVVHRVVSHNPDSFWAIARRENFSVAGTPAGGLSGLSDAQP